MSRLNVKAVLIVAAAVSLARPDGLAAPWSDLVGPCPTLAQTWDRYPSATPAETIHQRAPSYVSPAETVAAGMAADSQYGTSIPGPRHAPMIATRPLSWPGTPPPSDEDSLPPASRAAAALVPPASATVAPVQYVQAQPMAAPYVAPPQAPGAAISYATQMPINASLNPSPAGVAPPMAGVPYAPQTPLGAPAAEVTGGGSPAGAGVNALPADAQEFAGAAILARVGGEVILASEVALHVNETLTLNKDKIPPEYMEQMREYVTRQRLDALIDTKAVVIEVRRKIPAENREKIDDSLSDEFEKNELPRRLARAKVETRQQLDQKYRQYGTSLDREKRAYMETMLAQQWVQQQLKRDFEISHDEMLSYYYDHIADYEFPARAKWEQLMVRKVRRQSAQEAYARIAELGNRVLRGEPFADVARSGSEGPTAGDGGGRDWTTQGSLVSKPLDQALFTLPIGAMSAIIEDDDAFHIIRVVEREDAGREPFTETQTEIKETLKTERLQGQAEKYVSEVRERVPVSTVFDHLPPLDKRGPKRHSRTAAKPSR